LIGDGISQIIITLTLADLAINFAKNLEKHKANEISLINLDILTFIFEHLETYINYMGDDFEALLNLMNSFHFKTSPEIVVKTSKIQKDIYNLFWNQSVLKGKFKNEDLIFERVKSFSENVNKLYYTSENIYFQR